ncbi:hypothetical protein LXL04_016025 [Taraxacum kok-saghyz]
MLAIASLANRLTKIGRFFPVEIVSVCRSQFRLHFRSSNQTSPPASFNFNCYAVFSQFRNYEVYDSIQLTE